MDNEATEIKTFDTCPNCGSEKRLALSKINELKKKNVISNESFGSGPTMTVSLIDPKRPPSILAQAVKVNTLLVYWDVCEDCGTIYCTKFEPIEQMIPVQFQGMPDLPPPIGGRKFS